MEMVNIDQIVVEIRQEVSCQVARRRAVTPLPRRQNGSADILHLSGQLEQVNAILNLAESRSHVRTNLPDKLQHHPLTMGKLKGIMLKVFNLAFRDQREVNAGLIQASRNSNQVNQQILQELISLRSQMKQIQTELDQLSQSKS